MIHFRCPHCGGRLQVSEAHAGKEGPCPRCRKKLKIPPAPVPELQLVKDEATDTAPVPSKLLEQVAVGPVPLPVGPGSESPAGPTAQPSEVASSEGGASGSPLSILLYPLSISGVIHLLIFSFLPPLWQQALTLHFWMSPGIGPLFWLVVLTLYSLHYSAACLNDSAQGGIRAVDINSDATPLSVEALLSTFETIFPVVALIWGPPLAYYLVRGQADVVLVLWLAVAGLTFPMVLLSVHYFDSFRGANPILVVASIASVPGPYGMLVLSLLVPTALAILLMYLSVGSPASWIARPALIYALLVETHLLGRFYRRHQEQLNWGT